MQIYKTIIVEKDGPIFRIIFNRPEKKNAISQQMYEEITVALNEAAKDNDTLLTVFTGKGDYFSSGNDLAMVHPGIEEFEDFAKKANDLIHTYISTYIDHPKPLIALVNGPAIGVACTLLGIFDLVYASSKATFNTPFSKLGLVVEGCSSYTFPKLMGFSKASEILMFGKQLTAEEAYQRNLVTAIFPDEKFASETDTILKHVSQLPPQSLIMSRNLIRRLERSQLHQTNDAECAALLTRYTSEEFINAAMNFVLSKKSKL